MKAIIKTYGFQYLIIGFFPACAVSKEKLFMLLFCLFHYDFLLNYKFIIQIQSEISTLFLLLSLNRLIFKLCVFQEVIRLIQPVFLGKLVNFFASENAPKSQAFGYAFGIVVCHFAAGWCITPFNYLKSMAGVNIRVGVTGLIFKKVCINCKH